MKSKRIAEFGDFQTPAELAREAISCVRRSGIEPAAILEPSCGKGSFVVAAAQVYPNVPTLGLDINAGHLAEARQRLEGEAGSAHVTLIQANFFSHDWSAQLAALPGPILLLGNPPWVTNAELGLLGSSNLPAKSNFLKMKGFDALTGKSNFDISEWMLLQNLAWLQEKTGALAVLCKMAVARKILRFAWKKGITISDAKLYRIDADDHFDAAVEACLFVVRVGEGNATTYADVYENLHSAEPAARFGFVENTLVSNIEAYLRYSSLSGGDRQRAWRSGVKHDCASVMELERSAGGWLNGAGELVQLEETYMFPLVKSSDIGGTRARKREKYVIVPQRFVGDDTIGLQFDAPLTWSYLQRHKAALAARTSVIYRDKPDFSIFGVGKYSFAPWKVAISGFYKRLEFKLFGEREGKPVFFDDTVYFLSFEDESEATRVLELLNSGPAREFLSSLIFWDHKRPITAEVLNKLDLFKLADLLGHESPVSTARTLKNARPQLDLALGDRPQEKSPAEAGLKAIGGVTRSIVTSTR